MLGKGFSVFYGDTDDQYRRCGWNDRLFFCRARFAGFEMVFQFKPEFAATPGLAYYPDASIHQFHQFFGNGCTKSGTAKFSTDWLVGLGKIIENRLLFFFGHTNAGVYYFKSEPYPVVFWINWKKVQPYGPFGGKFDCISL